MNSDSKVDVLLKIRGEMELEIQTIRDTLAGKNKALAALNDTIDLVRGWIPTEHTYQTRVKTNWDVEAIKEELLDILTSGNKMLNIRELFQLLENKGLVPGGGRKLATVTSRLRTILQSMSEIRQLGERRDTVYGIKPPTAVR